MMKSVLVAFFFWLFVFIGLCGAHRFYMGRRRSGLLWLLTFGLCGVGQILDLFRLMAMVRKANLQHEIRSAWANIHPAEAPHVAARDAEHRIDIASTVLA